ncbi:MAG: hypothetical protein N2490_09125 [Ignavibacteria bacterium]|nr:hypothetical protein [Ignavibacteria bacterium]
MNLPDFFYRNNNYYTNTEQDGLTPENLISKKRNKKFKLKVIDKGIINTSKILSIYFDNNISFSTKDNFLNRIPTKIKILLLIVFLILISIANSIDYQLIIFFLLNCMSLIFIGTYNNLNVSLNFAKKIIYPTIFLGFLLSLPASLNLITKGQPLINIIELSNNIHFWFINVPNKIFISKEGFSVTMLITLRVFNSICITIMVLQSEPIEKIIDSLKVIGIPLTFRTILLITQKYIITFTRTVNSFYFSLKSRLFTYPDKSFYYKITGSRAFFLYKRTKDKFYKISLSMKSRGIQNI